jgi:hypothetical protein
LDSSRLPYRSRNARQAGRCGGAVSRSGCGLSAGRIRPGSVCPPTAVRRVASAGRACHSCPLAVPGWLAPAAADGLGAGLLRCRGRVLRWRWWCGHSCRVGLILRCPPRLLPTLHRAVHGPGNRNRGGGLQYAHPRVTLLLPARWMASPGGAHRPLSGVASHVHVETPDSPRMVAYHRGIARNEGRHRCNG